MLRLTLVAALASLLLAACGAGDGMSGPAGDALLSVTGLTPLDPLTQGRYEAWSVDGQGTPTSLGTMEPSSAGVATLRTALAHRSGTIVVTVQLSGDPAGPSARQVLSGVLRDGRATLSVEGAVTLGGQPLKVTPGQFTMFSPSDNYKNGYPSFEECGVWLFNMAPRQTPQNDQWVRLSPLTSGWTYEGWMVRDHGAAGAIWLSYGKFIPDASGAVSGRDDTGWGPYSGVLDFRTAGEEEFPGDDWFSNPLGFPWPSILPLPLDLREKNGQGVGRWSHVITIEPASDRGERIGSERPFAIRPYRDAFGEGAPGIPRTITFRPEGVPRGDVLRQ